MPVTAEELVRLLAILAEEENLKVTVKETLKGGAMAGAGAVIGGMCGGPVGLAVGKFPSFFDMFQQCCLKS